MTSVADCLACPYDGCDRSFLAWAVDDGDVRRREALSEAFRSHEREEHTFRLEP